MAGSNDWINYHETIAIESARKSENTPNAKTFTMCYCKVSKRVQLQWFIFTILLGLAFLFVHVFLKTDMLGLAIFCWVGAIFFLLYFLYQFSYRCHVTEKKIVRIEFWIFKKEIDWNCIKSKKINPYRTYQTGAVVLYNAKNKRVIDFVAEMVGYTNMEKMIKRKNLPSIKKLKKKRQSY